MSDSEAPAVPRLGQGALFLKFLKFGFLAFGGPVAQIAMLRQHLVDEERWISRDRFNRVLAVYQALPGPEATELCVYFGMIARGRLGGFLAGLGFVLPGLLLMLGLSAAYVSLAGSSLAFGLMFAGAQAAVAALILRGVQRIGSGVLKAWPQWGAAALGALSIGLGTPFYVPLIAGGVACGLIGTSRKPLGVVVLVAGFVATWVTRSPELAILNPITEAGGSATALDTLVAGLRGGLFTFGGAYTAIPFVREDAVVDGRWLTDADFLSGIALSGVLPAPLVIFVTFVGFLAAGIAGALTATLGMFLPAFGFTLVGHSTLERLVENQSAHAFLDGVAATVVGLIAVTGLRLAFAAVPGALAAAIFAGTLILLWRWKSPWAVPAAVVGAAVVGLLG